MISVLRAGVLVFLGLLTACGTTKHLLDQSHRRSVLGKQATALTEARKNTNYKKYHVYFTWVSKIKVFAQKELHYPPSSSYAFFHPGLKRPVWRLYSVKRDVWEPQVWSDSTWGQVAWKMFFDREVLQRTITGLQSEGYDVTAQETWMMNDGGNSERLIFVPMMQGGISVFVEHVMRGLTQEFLLTQAESERSKSCMETLAEEGTRAFLRSEEGLRQNVLPKYEAILRDMSAYRTLLREAQSRISRLLGTRESPVEQASDWHSEKEKIYAWLSRKLNAQHFRHIRPPFNGWNNALLYAELSCD